MNLTETRVKSLKPGAKQRDYFDDSFHPGSFMVRVYPTGRKVFRVAWREGDRRRGKKLGTWPATKLVEARKRGRQIIAKMESGHDPIPPKKKIPTLEAYYREHFKPSYLDNKAAIRPSTRGQYDWAFEKHILQAPFAKKGLQAIERAELESWIAALVDKELSRDTIQDIVKCLRRILNWAIEHKLIESHPVKKLNPLFRHATNGQENVDPWSAEEIRKVLDVARKHDSGRYYALFSLLLKSGLRIGEALALRWRDVDLEAGRLCVQLTYSGGQVHLPKTESSSRVIDLSPSLGRHLSDHKRVQRETFFEKGKELSNLVFSNSLGRHLNVANLRNRALYPIIKKAGVPRLSFHQFRDCFASQLLMAGAPPSFVSQVLGHRDPRVTMKHYAKWIPGSGDSFLRRLDEKLG